MLVTKPLYHENEIISIKISNGDEIVAKFVSQDEDGFTISKPMIVIPAQQGLALVPALYTATSGDNRIKFVHIMLHGETVEDVKSFYLTKTTGIQTVTKGSIIT